MMMKMAMMMPAIFVDQSKQGLPSRAGDKIMTNDHDCDNDEDNDENNDEYSGDDNDDDNGNGDAGNNCWP